MNDFPVELKEEVDVNAYFSEHPPSLTALHILLGIQKESPGHEYFKPSHTIGSPMGMSQLADFVGTLEYQCDANTSIIAMSTRTWAWHRKSWTEYVKFTAQRELLESGVVGLVFDSVVLVMMRDFPAKQVWLLSNDIVLGEGSDEDAKGLLVIQTTV